MYFLRFSPVTVSLFPLLARPCYVASLHVEETLSTHATCSLWGSGLEILQEWATSSLHCLAGMFGQQSRCVWGRYLESVSIWKNITKKWQQGWLQSLSTS